MNVKMMTSVGEKGLRLNMLTKKSFVGKGLYIYYVISRKGGGRDNYFTLKPGEPLDMVI